MPAIDPVILELRAETAKATANVRNYAAETERSLTRAGAAVDRSATAISVSSQRAGSSIGAMRQASIGAGQQLQDFAVQIGSGTSAVTALAQQLPQLAFQMSALEGSSNAALAGVGRFSTFMSGPWGAAILVAGLALNGLVSYLDQTGDASDKNAQKVDGFTDALKRLTAASGSINAADLGAADVAQRRVAGQIKVLDDKIAGLKSRPAFDPEQGGPATDALDAKIAKLVAARAKLVEQLDNLKATLKGSEIAFDKQQERAASIAASGSTTKGPTARAAGKSDEERAAEKAAAAIQRQNDALDEQTISMARALELGQMRANGLSHEADLLEAQWEIERRFPEASKDRVAFAVDLAKALVDQKVTLEQIAQAHKDIKAGLQSSGDVAEHVGKAIAKLVPKTKDWAEELERVKERGVDSLSYGLADAITGAESLGDAFSRVADQIIADLLRIAIQRALIEPLSGLFGDSGGGGDNAGAGLGSIGKLFSGWKIGFAGGGFAAPGSIHRVNEQNGGVELLRMGSQGGQVIPLGQADQTLSSPSSSQPGALRVEIGLTDDLNGRVAEISEGITVSYFRAAGPAMVSAAVDETMRRANRRTM